MLILPEPFHYNKYWLPFTAICGRDRSGSFQKQSVCRPCWADFVVESHPEINESEAWTLTWLLRHEQEATLPPPAPQTPAPSLCRHYALQPLAPHAFRAFRWSGFFTEETSECESLSLKNKKHLEMSNQLVDGCLGQLAAKRGLIRIHPCISFIFTVESVHYVTWQLKTQSVALSGKCVTWQRQSRERTRRRQKKSKASWAKSY